MLKRKHGGFQTGTQKRKTRDVDFLVTMQNFLWGCVGLYENKTELPCLSASMPEALLHGHMFEDMGLNHTTAQTIRSNLIEIEFIKGCMCLV